jgi:hypothetical protein
MADIRRKLDHLREREPTGTYYLFLTPYHPQALALVIQREIVVRCAQVVGADIGEHGRTMSKTERRRSLYGAAKTLMAQEQEPSYDLLGKMATLLHVMLESDELCRHEAQSYRYAVLSIDSERCLVGCNDCPDAFLMEIEDILSLREGRLMSFEAFQAFVAFQNLDPATVAAN